MKTFWTWLTAFPLRWTKLAFGGALVLSLLILSDLVPSPLPIGFFPSEALLGNYWSYCWCFC